MIQRIKKTGILLIMAVFLAFSSGIVITVHHCCSEHHHAANDHHHCHNDVMIFKITDNYNISFSEFNFQVDEFSGFIIFSFADVKENIFFNTLLQYAKKIPPQQIAENRKFADFVPYRIHYNWV